MRLCWLLIGCIPQFIHPRVQLHLKNTVCIYTVFFYNIPPFFLNATPFSHFVLSPSDHLRCMQSYTQVDDNKTTGGAAVLKEGNESAAEAASTLLQVSLDQLVFATTSRTIKAGAESFLIKLNPEQVRAFFCVCMCEKDCSTRR